MQKNTADGTNSLAMNLRKIMKDRFGIETDDQLMEAVENIDLDLGIFVCPINGGKSNVCKAM